MSTVLRKCPSRLTGIRRQAFALAIAAAGSLAVLSAAPPALAGIQQEFAVFDHCPVENPAVTLCIVSTVSGGEFKIGNKTVPINRTVTLQGGLSGTTLVPATDGNTLSKTPLEVPGGISGIEVLGGPLTDVTATAELAGPVSVSIENFNSREGTAVSLPLKVKLDNPLLLNECYVASNSEPISAQLITGTTNPPPPNTPISGSPGTLSFTNRGQMIRVVGSSLVDNAFAVPGANGCGGALAAAVDPALDLDVGLPAAAGKNTAILSGALEAAPVSAVKAQNALPEVGRCEKAEAVRVGKETRYHGAYQASCVEENQAHEGKFEWLPGAGPSNKFTASGAKTTLETVHKSAITCAATSGSGEYTGLKTASLTVTFTGCKEAGTSETCQSSGSAPGELVTPSLEGELGFIQDEEAPEQKVHVSVGLDVKRAPALLKAECGGAKTALSVEGSVIGRIGAIDRMTSKSTLTYAAKAGRQVPEEFEGGAKDTLERTLGSSAEQAGLKSALKLNNEGPLEIKAVAE